MPQDQTPLGAIKVSDMISKDTVVAENGSVYGPINYIKNFEEFSPGNPELQSGNFFPIKLSDEYEGQTIVVKRNDEERTRAQDLNWIIRVQSPETVYKFETDGGTDIITLNFKTARLKKPEMGVSAVFVPEPGTDMDAVNDSSKLIGDNVKIKWDGVNGVVSGRVHYYHFDDGAHFSDAPYGHYFPIVIKHYDGEEITTISSKDVEVKKVDSKWIIRVDDFITKGKKAIFKWKETTLASLDFSKVVLDPPPVNKVVVPRTSNEKHGNSCGKPVEDFSENLAIDETGKLTGTIKYVTEYNNPLPQQEYHEGNWLLLHFDKAAALTEDIKCGIGLENVVDTDKGDFNTNLRLTSDKIKQPCYVVLNDSIRYTLDLSELQLSPKGVDEN